LSEAPGSTRTRQLGLFAAKAATAPGRDDEIRRRLKTVDVDETTPRQALQIVAELKRLAEDDEG
jgi:hypothetical protein